MLFLLIIYRLIWKYGNATLNLRVISTIHISSTKQQYARMFQKQLRQCNFILKCKSNNSLVLQARTTNANKILITQRLCAFLALAQLLRNFVFLFSCSFSFNLTDTCIASPSFFTLMRKKATWCFYMFGGYFFPQYYLNFANYRRIYAN